MPGCLPLLSFTGIATSTSSPPLLKDSCANFEHPSWTPILIHAMKGMSTIQSRLGTYWVALLGCFLFSILDRPSEFGCAKDAYHLRTKTSRMKKQRAQKKILPAHPAIDPFHCDAFRSLLSTHFESFFSVFHSGLVEAA